MNCCGRFRSRRRARSCGVTPPAPAVAGRVYSGADLAGTVVGPSGPATAGPMVTPEAQAPVIIKPSAPREPVMSEAVVEPGAGGAREWGRFSLEPDYPVAFNVPPGTWWNGAFQGREAAWNLYAAGVFQVYTNSNNSIGWPNGRFETAFLSDASAESVVRARVERQRDRG